MTTESLTFQATSEARVSARLQVPESPRALLVLGHGAGADMTHAHMQAIADVLARRDVATLRYNFPYMEAGGKRTDKPATCIETIDNAISLAASRMAIRPLIAGGHSFGGRMTSHFAADVKDAGERLDGLAYFSFPLHPAKKPDVKRAAHLPGITLPQLFLSGTRDDLADRFLLRDVVATLPNATLHELDTADHGYRILKRTRTSIEDVYEEAGRVFASWLDTLTTGHNLP
ncbi:MAG: hypothetical protein KDI19_09810 [Pseudomonadales bacterium]|nr:hypothetical protein [Pseudomonadales bacterium]